MVFLPLLSGNHAYRGPRLQTDYGYRMRARVDADLWGTLAFQLASRAGELDAWAEHYFGISAGQSYTTQDDFIRWLLYFSPYLRIGEFVLGCMTPGATLPDAQR